MDSSEICASIASTLPPLFECSPAPQEGVRVRTPLIFPDGGIVDVFILERANAYIITDFGEALGWLSMQSVSLRRSPRQQWLIEDVCQTLGIELERGQLILRAGINDPLGEPVLRVAQAVVRVADIWFTFRRRSGRSTSYDVDKWLRKKQIRFDPGIRQTGESGRDWTIDFRTHTKERTSLVFLLSTDLHGAARSISEHVLAACIDLSHLKSNGLKLAFISLFDDLSDSDIWQEEHFRLVSEYSEVARWSNPDEFENLLRAS